MRIKTALIIGGWALALTACGGGSGSGGDLNRFVAGCDASTNLGREFCECAGKVAREDLSADSFAFLAATFDGDEAELEKLRKDLGPAEAIAAGMFMTTAYKSCTPAE